MLKIGIVLNSELFLAMMGQERIVGGDHMPRAWRKVSGGGVRMSLRTMRIVTSVMPMFFCWREVRVSSVSKGEGQDGSKKRDIDY